MHVQFKNKWNVILSMDKIHSFHYKIKIKKSLINKNLVFKALFSRFIRDYKKDR